MSLYSDYIKEREGKITIETDKGFISYKHFPKLRQLYVSELYVIPSERQSGAGEFFLNQVIEIAQDLGCTHIAATCDRTTNGWELVHKAAIKRNFKIVKTDETQNFYSKEI